MDRIACPGSAGLAAPEKRKEGAAGLGICRLRFRKLFLFFESIAMIP
jgi:hypothetical protein